MKVLIVEDEINAQKVLKFLIKEFFFDIDIVGTATGITEAKKLIKQHQPDLVFLDVRLEDGTGIELLQQLDNINFQIIFTTAYDNYAIQAIKFNASDYLLKPIDPGELKEAILKIKSKIQKEKNNFSKKILETKKNNFTITVKTSDKTFFISIKNIIRLEADGAYTTIITPDQTIIASKNLKIFEKALPKNLFIRTHQSHLVNKNHIKAFQKNGQLQLSNHDTVPVSFRKKSFVRNLLKDKH